MAFGEGEGMSIPTKRQVIASYKRLQKNCGFHPDEALEEVIANLLTGLRLYAKVAKQWEEKCERLKAKYEPMVAELSEKDDRD